MAFDPIVAANLSNAFRSACTTRIDDADRVRLERALQTIFAVKNLRNAQLWTRYGSTTRNFINRNLGQQELDGRKWFAEKFVNNVPPSFPTKYKSFLLTDLAFDASKFLEYYNDNFIREYTTRIFVENGFLYIEYSSDSNVEVEEIDLDSPEFEDVLEPPQDSPESPSEEQ